MITRIKRRRAGSYVLEFHPFDADGEPIAPAAGDVTILDGADVAVYTGTSTAIENGLKVEVPVAELPALDTYTTIWGDYDEERFELVGGHLFELADLRRFDGGYAADEDEQRLADARVWSEQRMEHPQAANVAFVPRGARERKSILDGRVHVHAYPSRIVSAVVDGEPVTPVVLDDHTLGVKAEGMLEIHYEHGLPQVEAPVQQAALILAKAYIVESQLSSRATSESTDVGFLRLSIAGAGGRTGIPEVDAVIDDERERHRHRWGLL